MNRAELLATVLGISGAVLNAFQMKIGFAVWIISNIMWIYFAVGGKAKYWGMALTFTIYTITSIIGLLLWE